MGPAATARARSGSGKEGCMEAAEAGGRWPEELRCGAASVTGASRERAGSGMGLSASALDTWPLSIAMALSVCAPGRGPGGACGRDGVVSVAIAFDRETMGGAAG